MERCGFAGVVVVLGALLFLIAGLYLPELTSLKAGPLQLEKGTVAQVGAGGALGITVSALVASQLFGSSAKTRTCSCMSSLTLSSPMTTVT